MDISKEKLIDLFARSIMTMDGLWFLSAEEKYGLDKAIEMDCSVWQRFMPIHLKRVMKTFDIKEDGITGLFKAFEVDPIWSIFKPEFPLLTKEKCVIRMTDCPPQKARVRDGRGEFPCKEVGIACFRSVIKDFLPDGELRCIVCPPDPHPENVWCEWEFCS